MKGLMAGIGILILILDSKTALSGANSGITLCSQSVIPSIFPFLILTGVLLPLLSGKQSGMLRPISRLLRIPQGTESIFLMGLLGGYPTGALMVTQAWKNGQLKRDDARRMLAFCSNAGPSFLFGILGSKFPNAWMLWVLWLIHIVSAVLTAVLLPGPHSKFAGNIAAPSVTWTDSLKNAVRTMAYICGWVVFFRVVIAFLDRWVLWLLPVSARVIVYGILELANGCCNLNYIASDGLRFVICSGILAFGGVCVMMQTASVTGSLGLGYYLPGKLLQMAFSIILSFIAQMAIFHPTDKMANASFLPVVLSVFIMVFVILGVKKKIRARNPVKVGV